MPPTAFSVTLVSCLSLSLTLFAAAHSEIALRSAKLGRRSKFLRRLPVTGHVLCPCSNQRLILGLSYVWPVATITGSFMSSMETGHRKCGGADAVVEGEGAALLPWSSTPTSIFASMSKSQPRPHEKGLKLVFLGERRRVKGFDSEIGRARVEARAGSGSGVCRTQK